MRSFIGVFMSKWNISSLLAGVSVSLLCGVWITAQTNRGGRNVIVFVADGLRPGSVNAKDTPALWSIRQQGVNFTNSHSLVPTFTMANAAAIATGHAVGDTGIFSNTVWVGYPTYTGTPTPFIENDRMLSEAAARFSGGFPSETALLSVAVRQGFNGASIGKLGPTALLNMGTAAPLIVDDSTGNLALFPLPPNVVEEMKGAGLSTNAPSRSNGFGPTSEWNNGYAGTAKQAGTRMANSLQQQWFADVTTRVILPMFKREAPKPFVLMYWSRDPDGSQHNQGDSLHALSPGINGNTSRLGVQNADRNLKQILDWLAANPGIKANTDIFVTSDHGFATISKREVARGVLTKSVAATHNYVDSTGDLDVERGTLPYGFLAIDLALGLHTNLFDPDRSNPPESSRPFRQVRLGPQVFERPALGDGLLGDDVKKNDGSDAMAIVAANGGSDLIYLPNRDPAIVQRILGLLVTFDYVGGIFVDDMYGQLPGALPMSELGLIGASPLPRPAILVVFKVFNLTPGNLQTAIQVTDGSQQQGQGNHGGLGRDTTFNNMAAIGPDFKAGYVDRLPVSNADIAPTIAHILGIEMPSNGKLRGRVTLEALRGGVPQAAATARIIASAPTSNRRTILHIQEIGAVRYIDRGCFIEVMLSCQ